MLRILETEWSTYCPLMVELEDILPGERFSPPRCFYFTLHIVLPRKKMKNLI